MRAVWGRQNMLQRHVPLSGAWRVGGCLPPDIPRVVEAPAEAPSRGVDAPAGRCNRGVFRGPRVFVYASCQSIG